MGHIDTVIVTDNTEISCRCARCGTGLNVVSAQIDRYQHEGDGKSDRSIEVDFVVDPHLCTDYMDDNGTRMKQVKDHNDILQKRNTELVEENRRLKADGESQKKR